MDTDSINRFRQIDAWIPCQITKNSLLEFKNNVSSSNQLVLEIKPVLMGQNYGPNINASSFFDSYYSVLAHYFSEEINEPNANVFRRAPSSDQISQDSEGLKNLIVC